MRTIDPEAESTAPTEWKSKTKTITITKTSTKPHWLMQPMTRALIDPLRPLVRAAARVATHWWPAYSRLFILADSPRWVLAEERRQLVGLAQRLGLASPDPRLASFSRRQCLFYLNHMGLLNGRWPEGDHRIALAYYHGLPGSGNETFDACFDKLRSIHPRISRIVVTHGAMRELVLASGIDPAKVFLIPLAVDLTHFRARTADSCRRVRARFDIPPAARVVGSFQKDGVGWGDGMEPKLIKGPDIFLKAIEILKPRVPELFVLLSGPARGYVKAGLERLGVPQRHFDLDDYDAVGQLYQALDVYLVASRQEGGPKAILESMASGVPLVTTHVGQATELVRHGENGWMVDVEDAAGLARWAELALNNPAATGAVVARARAVAEANSYAAQLALWRAFFKGFVEGCR
jgi:glycosyltransferase involved in cell wall biosynthesis